MIEKQENRSWTNRKRIWWKGRWKILAANMSHKPLWHEALCTGFATCKSARFSKTRLLSELVDREWWEKKDWNQSVLLAEMHLDLSV